MNATLSLLGRAGLSLIFIISGWGKIAGYAATQGYMESMGVPGALLPVNVPAVAHVPDLFARNERLVCYVDGPLGRVAVIAVGAYNVGRISAAFDPAWNAPPGASADTGRACLAQAGSANSAAEPPIAKSRVKSRRETGAAMGQASVPGHCRLSMVAVRTPAQLRARRSA